ncbi:hypothetical protein Vadar_002944 [Vaccinium darrowii]|uniref:Uncharacterized protein n=1 Tax=Vaccinium darrowii TaxID=229202 RepID=A0ACB7Y558_9ERIC|nr:hypothetical protein Vadar_002944 [Vaccinium darrowii]
MEDDWDLYAVVRGCSAASASTSTSTAAAATTTASCSRDTQLSSSSQSQDDQFQFFSDPFEPRRSQSNEDLQDLFRPFFFPESQQISPQNTPVSPHSVLGGLQDLYPPPPLLPQHQSQQQPQEKQEKQKQNHVDFETTGGPNSTGDTPTPRSKRRKSQLKRVCQVPAEGLSADSWSWRKYGQKPIKGSPFPRGYYKCSTSKGCLARKQVERNRSDPVMFIVTYTGEHNHPMPTHRNSLAGIPRQKSVTTETVTTTGDTTKPSSPLSPVSEKTESREDVLMEDDEEDEDDVIGGVSDTAIGDDFFEGLEEFTDPGSLPGNVTILLDVPVKVPHYVLLSLVRDIGADWGIDYELELGFTVDLPIVGNFTISVTRKGEIKLPCLSDL